MNININISDLNDHQKRAILEIVMESSDSEHDTHGNGFEDDEDLTETDLAPEPEPEDIPYDIITELDAGFDDDDNEDEGV